MKSITQAKLQEKRLGFKGPSEDYLKYLQGLEMFHHFSHVSQEVA